MQDLATIDVLRDIDCPFVPIWYVFCVYMHAHTRTLTMWHESIFIFGVGFALSVSYNGQCEGLIEWNGNSRTPRFFYMPQRLTTIRIVGSSYAKKNLSFMSNKKQNEELQSRREFFKKAAKAALPMLGMIALADLPVISQAAEVMAPTGCNRQCGGACSVACSGRCSGTCKGNCSSCSGTCQGTCTGRCSGTCRSSCTGGCGGSCGSACSGGCSGGCKGGCQTGCSGCTGSCQYTCQYGCQYGAA